VNLLMVNSLYHACLNVAARLSGVYAYGVCDGEYATCGQRALQRLPFCACMVARPLLLAKEHMGVGVTHHLFYLTFPKTCLPPFAATVFLSGLFCGWTRGAYGIAWRGFLLSIA